MKNLTKKLDNKYTNLINCTFIVLISFLLCLKFAVATTWRGYDLPYHFEAIQTLNESWGTNLFFKKIYDNICSGFGYGTGLFYSTIPSGICVVLMNVLNLNIQWAWCLEFTMLFAISGVVVYFFIKRIFNKKSLAFICAVCYVLFPYFIINLFYRTAISELFLMLAIPCIAWGLYELQYNKNYKAFIPLFTFGCTLAIFVHIAVTMYIAIFTFVFLAVDYKRFFKEYRYIPFLIACLLVLLLTACFYVPMFLNYPVTQTSSMGHTGLDLFWSACQTHLPNNYNFFSALLSLFVLVLFLIVYFKRARNREDNAKHTAFMVVAIMGYWLNSPLFPWFIMPKIFAMIQHLHRLFMINSILWVIELGYIINYSAFKNRFKIFSYIFVGLCLVTNSALAVFDVLKFGTEINPRIMYNSISCYSVNEGMGYDKNGDYYPKGATKDYVFTRANDDLIKQTNGKITELANFKQKDLIYLQIEPCEDVYITFKIPYKKLNFNDKIYLMNVDYINDNKIEITAQNNFGDLFIELGDLTHNSVVIIKYTSNDELDEYLKENPFEFKVKSGSANITNFEKKWTTDYTVDIDTTVETRIELPSLFYKGYKVTYTTANGCYNLTAEHGENGFVETVVNESGTLHVEFAPNYVDVANIISIIGVCLFAIIMLLCLLVPREKFTKFGNRVTEYFKTHKNAGEILRFIIVGGIATLVDMFTMGVVMYLMQKSIYTGFLNVFIHAPTPSTLATIIGTTVGFLVGLVVNYVLSILFVFNEKGNSKSAKGFMVFALLSAVGLGINILGTFIGFDLLHLNQWLVKIVMVFVVLVYNYISKKLLLFKNKNKSKESANK